MDMDIITPGAVNLSPGYDGGMEPDLSSTRLADSGSRIAVVAAASSESVIGIGVSGMLLGERTVENRETGVVN
jgi:hypothetical protein